MRCFWDPLFLKVTELEKHEVILGSYDLFLHKMVGKVGTQILIMVCSGRKMGENDGDGL